MSKKEFSDFADVFFMDQKSTDETSVSNPMILDSCDMFDTENTSEYTTNPESVDMVCEQWTMVDRAFQIKHLETRLKHLRQEIMSEYDVFGLTANVVSMIVDVIGLIEEWKPICVENLQSLDFAVYLVETDAYVRGLIGDLSDISVILENTADCQKLVDCWKELQNHRDTLAMKLKEEHEFNSEQKEILTNEIYALITLCDQYSTIFSENKKLCVMISQIKDTCNTYFSRLKDS